MINYNSHKENAMKYGVFDSGLGGMTVLSELIKMMPENDYIYFGDVARVPYGTRSNETIIKYAREDAAFLIEKGIDAIIIACGTVSSVAHEILLGACNVPVYSVIDFAVKAAAQKTKNKKIGVIGTQATIGSGMFAKKLKEQDTSLTVIPVACPLFVPLIENGIRHDDEIAYAVAKRYMDTLISQKVDTVIMGCTHYPVYTKTLQKIYPNATYINTGFETALQLSASQQKLNQKGTVELYVSEISQAFYEISEIMGFTLSKDEIKTVDVSGYTL